MAMYVSCMQFGGPATNPTDVVTISGINGGLVKIRDVQIDGTATATSTIKALLIKRSTASTGNGNTPNTLPLNSGAPSCSATVTYWNSSGGGNPSTLGTSVGTISQNSILLTTSTTATATNNANLVPLNIGLDGAVVLINANECLAVSLNGATMPSGTALAVTLVWEEILGNNLA